VEDIFNLRYALDTFYFLVSGALVMWMAAGFAMLEAGLVRAKNTAEILTKNIALFAVACIMYMVCGYNIMYPGDAGGNGYIPNIALSFMFGGDHDAAEVGPIIPACPTSSSRSSSWPRPCLSSQAR
jgi:Amt family ammonium transporter